MLPSVIRIPTRTNWEGAKYFELKQGDVKKQFENSGKIKATKKEKRRDLKIFGVTQLAPLK